MSESVDAVYRGFLFRISERQVDVFMGGRRVTSVRSVKQARLFVRGWRRAEREERSAA